MDREWVRPTKNGAGIFFSALLVLAIAAGAYLLFDSAAIHAQARQMTTLDYSIMRQEARKGGQAQAPGVSVSEQFFDVSEGNYFITPMGFPIISYSQKWAGGKLVEIYDELIRNEHGSEILAISSVTVHPEQSSSGQDIVTVAGTHVTHFAEYPVFFHVPGVVPDSLVYGIKTRQSVIELFNMDEYDSAAEVAKTIAHEYGHHYSMYYFLPDDETARMSEYYRLRGISDYGREVFFSNDADYYQNHMWSLYELAAEDYVQLMGSPNAKQAREYFDVFDNMYSREKYTSYANAATYNVYPQENIYLPLADEVGGLRDYYLSFIDKKSEYEAFAPFDFNLQATKKSSYGHTHYEITWDKPTKESGALYTLVCYDADGQVFLPVRTVRGNEEAKARVGTATRTLGTTVSTFDLIDTKSGKKLSFEDKSFRLYALWPDGRMQSSELFDPNF